MSVKTHTFKLGKYHIMEGHGYDGVCDIPSKKNERLEVRVLTGRTEKALGNQIHEFLHADDCPDKFLHRDDRPCDNLARALIRMGWERKVDNAAPMEK